MTQFDLQQAMKAQSALRTAAGLSVESFDIAQLIGMLSDEIQVLRATGSSDADIADILKDNANLDIDADTIGKYYVETSEWKQ